MAILVGIAEDHGVVLDGIRSLISSTPGYKVSLEAANGEEFLNKLKKSRSVPRIGIIDIHMPVLDGLETIKRIKELYPYMHCIALSNDNNPYILLRSVECGAQAYVLKEKAFEYLLNAMNAVINQGYYYDNTLNNLLSENYVYPTRTRSEDDVELPRLTDREKEFIVHCCSDMPYKEIAKLMKVSARTIDTYRDHVSKKLRVGSRVGIVLYAITHGLAHEIK